MAARRAAAGGIAPVTDAAAGMVGVKIIRFLKFITERSLPMTCILYVTVVLRCSPCLPINNVGRCGADDDPGRQLQLEPENHRVQAALFDDLQLDFRSLGGAGQAVGLEIEFENWCRRCQLAVRQLLQVHSFVVGIPPGGGKSSK